MRSRRLWYHEYPIDFLQGSRFVHLRVRHAYGNLRARVEFPADWQTWPEHQLLRTAMAQPELQEFWQTLIALPMRQFSVGTLKGG